MNAIINSFKAIFPIDADKMVKRQDNCSITETGAKATLKDFTWEGSDLLIFEPLIAEKMSGFFKQYNAIDVFMHNCDGVMLHEANDSKYLFITELKSSFDTKDIAKAKKQIISSYLKFNMLLNLAQYWKNENIVTCGFIVSHGPKHQFRSELKRDAAKIQNSKDRHLYAEKYFCGKLLQSADKGKYMEITPYNSYHLSECMLGERGVFPVMKLYYIEVPQDQSHYTQLVTDYL